jgi:hypothetical protein
MLRSRCRWKLKRRPCLKKVERDSVGTGQDLLKNFCEHSNVPTDVYKFRGISWLAERLSAY